MYKVKISAQYLKRLKSHCHLYSSQIFENQFFTKMLNFGGKFKGVLLKICERHDAEISIMPYPYGEDLKIVFST